MFLLRCHIADHDFHNFPSGPAGRNRAEALDMFRVRSRMPKLAYTGYDPLPFGVPLFET